MTRRSLLDLPVTLPRHRGIVHSLFTLHWIKQTCYGIKFVTGIQKRKQSVYGGNYRQVPSMRCVHKPLGAQT